MVSNFETTERITIDQSGFIRNSDVVEWADTPSNFYKRGNKVSARLYFKGSLSIGSIASVKIGNVGKNLRPSVPINTASHCNGVSEGQIYDVCAVYINPAGNVYVIFNKYNTTIGNDTYPWCSTDGLSFSYDLI